MRLDIEASRKRKCQESDDGPCDTYENLSTLHKENPGFWTGQLDRWKSAPPQGPRRSVRDEIKLRKKWEENAQRMGWDIQECCERKCQEGDRPCDTYEKMKDLHKENRGFWGSQGR